MHTHESDSQGGVLDINNATHGILQQSKGGTAFDRYSTGDLLVGNPDGQLHKLPVGANGEILAVSGALLGWKTITAIAQAGNDSRYLQKQGGTLSGQLVINLTSGTVGLKVLQTISGATVHADRALESSGTLVVKGATTLGGGATVHGAFAVLTSNGSGLAVSQSGAVTVTRNIDTSIDDAHYNTAVTMLVRNTGELPGPQDYQNEVHLTLQAGTSANHREYLNFNDYTGDAKWLTGRNAKSVYIVYNRDSGSNHRLWLESADPSYASWNSGNSYFNSAGSGVVRINYDLFENAGQGGFEVWSGGPLARNVPWFDVTHDGRVAIGTNTPLPVGFHIDTSKTYNNQIAFTGTGTIPNTAAGQIPGMYVNNFNGFTGLFLQKVSTGGGDYLTTEDRNHNTKFIVKSSGNVGIATTSPGSKLSVSGAVLINPTQNGSMTADANVALEIIGTASGRILRAQDTLASSGTLSVKGISAFGGNIAVRGNLSGSALTVMNGTSYLRGNLGLGKTAPSTKLDVVGTISGSTVIGTHGLTTNVVAGACDDTSSQATNGTMCIDSTDGRIYFRYGAAWHYAAQTAGFQIPKMVRNGKDETVGLSIGDPVIGRIDEVMADGALHGVWEKMDLQSEVTRTLVEHPELIGKASSSGSTSPSLNLSDIKDLILQGTLEVSGKATFLGDVSVQGTFSLSTQQAGNAEIPAHTSEVHVSYSHPFGAPPIVTASPDGPLSSFWWLADKTPAGFTIRLSAPADVTLPFSWLAIPVEGSPAASVSSTPSSSSSSSSVSSSSSLDASEGGSSSVSSLIAFPVDSKGVPVSSDPLWNACIRRIPVFDADGKPLSCSRYGSNNQWHHPDLGITFGWNDDRTPPVLDLPPGYAPTVVGDAVLPSSSSASSEGAVSSSTMSSTGSSVSSSSSVSLSSSSLSSSSSSDAGNQASSVDSSSAPVSSQENSPGQ